MNKNNYERNNKKWIYLEKQFLKENWGFLSIEEISKVLKRNATAIKIQASRMKLGDAILKQEEISLNKFAILLGKKSIHSWFLSYLKRLDFPIKRYKKSKRCYNMVNFEQFIKWLKNHLHDLDISNTEDGDFGAIEPDWLIEKRKADKMAMAYKMRDWTLEEDNRLISLLNEFKYGYREISTKLKRTECSIKRRLITKKIKARPLKADNHVNWTDKEIAIVKDLYLKGYEPCVIAEFVPRSALAINGLLERKNFFKKDI